MTADFSVSAARLHERVRRLLDIADAGDGTLPIVEAGDPVLRQQCVPVDGQLDDRDLNRLVEAMHTTMRAAPGVGLAAPQVGLPLRIFVAEDPVPDDTDPGVAERLAKRSRVRFGPRTVLNASYAATTDRTASFYEGCLSIPGYQAVVDRPLSIHLTGSNLDGSAVEEELTGWPARIVAHESDHLDGILFLDAAQMRSLATNAAVAQWWADADTQAAASALGFEIPTTSVF